MCTVIITTPAAEQAADSVLLSALTVDPIMLEMRKFTVKNKGIQSRVEVRGEQHLFLQRKLFLQGVGCVE